LRNNIEKLKGLKDRPNFIAYLCLAAVCILWGTTWVASTYSVRQGTPAFQVVMWRQFFAGFIMFTGIFIYKKGKVDWPPLKDTFFLSFLNFLCSNGVSTWAVQYLPGGIAAILGATYPLWLVLIYYFFFNKPINYKVWVGLCICFLGLLVIFIPKLSSITLGENYWFGLCLCIFSTITWALGNIYTKNQNNKNIDPYLSLSLQMLMSSALLFIVLKPLNILVPIESIKMEVWFGISYLVLIGSVIAYSCFLYALKNLEAEQVSIYAYVNPIVALIVSYFFMNEEINTYTIVGTIVVLGGLYLLNKSFNSSNG
jgi:drug/metabolite transporter (DMT)-like permease